MNHDTLVEIFFTITAAAIIIITLLIAIVVIYAISIIRTFRRIIRTAEFAAEMLKEDMSELRQSIKTKGLSLSALLSFFRHIGKRRILHRRKK
jgi:biopolymer transport protein ExbB/TolQ